MRGKLFIKNEDILTEDSYGKYHNELFNSSKSGNYDEFMKYVGLSHATRNDLEWCLEDCTDVNIAKYIIEERGITGWAYYCHKKAVENGNTELSDYLRNKFEYINLACLVQKGDTESKTKFFELAQKIPHTEDGNELFSKCISSCKDTDVLKYLIEEREIDGGEFTCFSDAIKRNDTEMINYMKEHYVHIGIKESIKDNNFEEFKRHTDKLKKDSNTYVNSLVLETCTNWKIVDYYIRNYGIKGITSYYFNSFTSLYNSLKKRGFIDIITYITEDLNSIEFRIIGNIYDNDLENFKKNTEEYINTASDDDDDDDDPRNLFGECLNISSLEFVKYLVENKGINIQENYNNWITDNLVYTNSAEVVGEIPDEKTDIYLYLTEKFDELEIE